MSPGICDSVHIDGVESELVVRFGHSVQSHPKAPEEVRRILRDHLHLRNDMTDAQVWITKGNNPLLHRLVITYRHENGQPEFRADFHDWNFINRGAGFLVYLYTRRGRRSDSVCCRHGS